MHICVINKRPGSIPAPPGASIVYIGRPSLLSNQRPIDAVTTRKDVIDWYRDWLRAQYKAHGRVYDLLHTLAHRAATGEHLALQCWCAPLPCHADVVRDALLGIIERTHGSRP